jgi:hypothetical protein
MATESRTPLLSPHGMIDGDRGSRNIWIIDAIADPDADSSIRKHLQRRNFIFQKGISLGVSRDTSADTGVIYLSFVILPMDLMSQTEMRRHPRRNSTQGHDVLDDLQKNKMPSWELPIQTERK